MEPSFLKRSGTTDKGREYEDVVLANFVLLLLNDPSIKDFYISSNDANFGAFDDIVIQIKSDKGDKVKALQLKHSERKILSTENLQSKKGDFSITKYFQSFLEIEDAADEYILYTNRPFKYKESAKFQLEGEEFYIEVVRVKSGLEFSGTTSCAYKFQIVEDSSSAENFCHIQEYKKFFDKFYLYADQDNVEKLKIAAARKFTTTYSSGEEIFDKFVRTICEWNMQKGKIEKLNRKRMQCLIALHLLSSQIEPLSFGSVSDKMKIFREAVSFFDITLFDKQSCNTIKQLWGDVGKETRIDLKELNKVRKRYLPNVRHIDDNNIVNVDPKALSQLLWLMDECPLILRERRNVENAIHLCPDKKFILVDGSKSDEWMKKFSVFQDLSNLNKKPDLREKVLENFTVSLQGKEELNLVTAFGGEILENVTTDNLVEMLDGPCRLGGEKESLPQPYIERYLSRNIVNNTYLENVHENTIIILSYANNFDKVKDKLEKCKLIDIDDFLHKKYQTVDVANRKKNHYDQLNLDNNENKNNLDKSKFGNTIYAGNRRYNDSELQLIYNGKKNIEQFHYFQILSDGNLELIQSKGDVSDFEGYKLPDKYVTEERVMWSSRLDNFGLIAGDPGMGKSELMKSFKNKCPPEFWTVIINPKDVNLFFHNFNFSKPADYTNLFENFITNENCRSLKELDRKFFEMCIKKNNVIFVWDALDEILNKNLDAVSNIILDFSTKGFRQWVTSRRHLRTTLEKKFSLLSFSINRFSEQEQENYIRKRLKSFNSQYNIDVTVEKIKSSFAIVEHVDILGIPLQIFMLTELFREDSEKYLRLMDNTFVLTDLYEYFIQEKFNKFYKDKIGYDFQNPQMEIIVGEKKRKALDYYQSASFKVVFDEETMQRLNINYEKCLKKLVGKYASVGLVSDFENNVPRFLHSSFAEYLVARYFSKNINNLKNEIMDILFDARYNNVRFFFDMLLAKNSKAHIAVLYKRYELVKTYDDEILTRKDEGGRSPLHLISSWGQRHPRVKMTVINGDYIVHEDKNFVKKPETEAYFETMTYLQGKNDNDDRDILLNATPLSYARKSESVGAEMQLLQTKLNELKQLCTRDDVANIVFYSALLGYDDLCQLFTVDELNHYWYASKFSSAKGAETPLLLSCKIGNLKLVDYFVKSGVEINRVNENGCTPLYLASLNGHDTVVKYLTTVGGDCNRANNNGGLPLHVASFNGHESVVKYLVTGGAEFNRVDNWGFTPLYVASQSGHLLVVEYLVTVGAEINRAADDGRTPLYIAAFNGHEKVVEYLTAAGVEINRATNNGVTPLYAASFNGHRKIVEYLTTVGAEINRAMNDGSTPLCTASRNGHENVVKYLATVGAEINRVDVEGLTPLYVACQKGHENVVQYLVTVGAEVNRANKFGRTPLYTASFNGHQKVVECLTTVGAKINYVDVDGSTPLYAACQNGHRKIVEYLITVGADVHCPRNDGAVPLHVASYKAHEKVVEYLITVGAEINRADSTDYTPLFIAAFNGHENVVEILARAGAEINCTDNLGRTPLEVASQNGHKKVAEYLRRLGAEISNFID
ncbi:uncharacterized protein LOC135123308 [Zophobas morio]|uniref:uncharacterized protein LOC135123308 n=1 Tax=Zophobas morio TaxID=2755281 RepID=UPI003082A0E7